MAESKSPEEQLEDLKSEMLMREAQEELRREQLEKFWKAYQPWIIGVAALILAGIGGYQMLKSRAVAIAEQAGDQLSKAIQLVEDGKGPDASRVLTDLTDSGLPGHAALARLNLAAIAAKDGKNEDAVKALDAIAEDGSTHDLLRDTARLKAAMLRVDSADWTEMTNRLTVLTGEDGRWRFAARELLGLAAYRLGKLAEAKQAFQQIIADATAPPSLSQRAQVVMGQIVAAELAAKFPPPPVPPAAPPAPFASGPTTGTATVTVPAPAPPAKN